MAKKSYDSLPFIYVWVNGIILSISYKDPYFDVVRNSSTAANVSSAALPF
jgi:hypothetical protein